MADWTEVSKRHPCPVCEKDSWCGITIDGTAARCMRVENGKPSNGGWIHKLNGSVATLPPKRTSKATPQPDFELLNAKYQAAVNAPALGEHAQALGVSADALSRLGIGYDGQAWTFPMRDVSGRVVGIRRRFADGQKLSVKGGHDGLFVPSDLSKSGTLYVCEGPTDTAALLTLGLEAIGRPSCSGGVRLCRDVCKGRPAVIVADSDGPGRKGACALGEDLVSVCASVRNIEPPSGTKDMRAWVRAGATAANVQAAAAKVEPLKRQQHVTETGDDWAEPIPFGVFDLPAFPLDAIPEQLSGLRDFCDAAAESFQVPADMVAIPALTVGAAALAKTLEVEVKPDWREPVNLFSVVAMPSGERKSGVFRAVTTPLTIFEREENERLAPLVEKNRNERLILEAELKKARDTAAKAKAGDDKLVALAEVEQLAEELRTCELVVPLQLVADDATPEAISQLIDEQGGRVALLSPEGDVFDLMSGRYSDGVSRLGVYLKGHAGDDIRVNRVGRGREYVRNPALTVGLAVQPDVLQGLLEKPQLRGRGLLARFLYSLPVSRVGYRQLECDSIPERVTAAYARLIRAALQLEPAAGAKGELVPHVLRMSPEALNELLRFCESVERELREGGELAGLRDWGSKLPGAVCRIAGVFHGLIQAPGGNPAGELIDVETVLGAVSIGEYFTAHAQAAFLVMGCDAATALAQRLLRWLTDSMLTEFSKRDAHRAVRVQKVASLDEPLRLLAERGYIREQFTEHTRPGRAPSPRYEVNPQWVGQKGQNGQNSDSEGIVSVVSILSGGVEK